MNKMKEVGCFNVNINDGVLNHDDNRWYYGLNIDRFGKDEIWEGHKFFYITGHKDGDGVEQNKIGVAVNRWLEGLTEEEVEEVYRNVPNHRFTIELRPKLI